ncbi:hypothetical protein G4B88_031457 [Cannabis sativa]|uniref:Isopenicillin N synthase-like Fe(2+) 2OG dioxygenase domain-containing protein n=1 Tax=Cannabis sativa TaxID=3483 RepID=A0A7J6G486_CANSA|nr:hypothetical protein G4B88_031457 [Cannabis sativa]
MVIKLVGSGFLLITLIRHFSFHENVYYLFKLEKKKVLSNGKYKSVLHRSLVNKKETQMSWAVFCASPHQTMIGPLPELVDEHNLPKFSTKTYAEYRHRKLNKLPQ